MQIRFLETVESSAAGFPFQPGQVIAVTQMTSAIRSALRDGRAEVLRTEEPELATVVASEHAVTRHVQGKRRAR